MLAPVNEISAYLFLNLAEQEPIAPAGLEPEEENEWYRANESWYLQPEPFEIDLNRVERFIDQTAILMSDLENLEVDLSEPAPPQYMSLFYDAAKETFDHDKSQLRTYFRWLYLIAYGYENGPRWGEMVSAMGVNDFTSMIRRRFARCLYEGV